MGKHKLSRWLCLICFLAGLLIFFFPVLHKCYVNYQMGNTVESFLELSDTPAKPPPALPSTAPEEPQKADRPYRALWQDMQAYNETIWKEKQAGLSDTRAYEKPSFDLRDYDFPEAAFGVLTIPKMRLRMPLYLGATWQHMADGAAQLSQTSIPIGGENTNAVIAGHRGWCGAPYFREIMTLKAGDFIYIQNPWQTLTYQVSEIQVIAPDDVDAIHIQPGRDLVTLLTCHPYASGGRQRYLVICQRSEN